MELEINEAGTKMRFLGREATLPPIPEPNVVSEPVELFKSAGRLVTEAAEKIDGITSDAHLSAEGKAARSDPLRADALGRVAAASAQLTMFERGVDAREQALYAVPELDPSAAAVAIEDREMRDWWRSLPTRERKEMLDHIKDAPDQHQRLAIALLRAPAPLAALDHELKVIGDVWRQSRRAADLARAAQLDFERASVEFAREGLAHMAGITRSMTGWNGDRTLRALLTSPLEPAREGWGVFNFGRDAVEHMRLRLDAEAHRKAA